MSIKVHHLNFSRSLRVLWLLEELELDYFSHREGKLNPTDEAEKLECRMFLHYAEGSLMSPLLVSLIFARLRSAPMPFFIKPIARGIADNIDQSYTHPALDLHLGFMEKTLSERPYFAGDSFSIADVQMFYPVEAALSRASGGRPNMVAWRDRVTSRPAYQRAEAKGGKAVPER